MTETTEAAVATHSTIKQYRDEIRTNLAAAYKVAGKYDPAIGEATGAIKRTLKGKVGFSKAEQIAALEAAQAQFDAAVDAVNEIDPQAVAAKVEAEKQAALDALQAALDATVAAAALASERDFDAYITEKNAAKYSHASYDDEYADDEDDDY